MEILRSWRELRVMLKWRYPFLTDKDFFYEEGKKDSMLDKLAKKIDKTRNELELIFADLQKQ
jgi:hypothetical protein